MNELRNQTINNTLFSFIFIQIKNQNRNSINNKRNSQDIGTARMNAIERALEKIQIEFQKIKHSQKENGNIPTNNCLGRNNKHKKLQVKILFLYKNKNTLDNTRKEN